MADENLELDLLFRKAQQQRTHLPEALAVLMMTDAEAVRLDLQRSATVPRPWWRVFDIIGGWPGMGGLVAAGCAGVWIGFAAPGFLPDAVTYLISPDVSYLSAELDLDDLYPEDVE